MAYQVKHYINSTVGAMLLDPSARFLFGASGGGTTGTIQTFTTTGTSGAATYNSTTGVLNIPQYASSIKEQFYGVIYNKNTWVDLSDFTVSGGLTASISGGKILVSSTAGDFTHSLDLNYNTMLERWKIQVRIQVQTKNSTSYGVGVGINAQNSNNANSVVSSIGYPSGTPATNGLIFMNNGRNGTFTQIAQSATAVSLTANDYIIITMERNVDTITTNVWNSTSNSAQATTAYIYLTTTTPYIHSSGKFSIYVLGGTYLIDSLKITSNETRNADLMIIGDSKAQGFFASDFQHRFFNIVGQKVKTSVLSAGGGDRTVDVIARMPEILALAPKQALLMIGSNDPRFGISDPTFQANYQSIATSLTNAGIKVLYSLPMFETSEDLTSQKTFILATFSSTLIVDTWTPMTLNGSLNADGTHPSPLGHVRIADAILISYIIDAPNNSLDFVVPGTFASVFPTGSIDMGTTYITTGAAIRQGDIAIQSNDANNAVIGYNIQIVSSAFKYIQTRATEFIIFNGAGTIFGAAASGTAGTTITPTYSLYLLNNGNALLGRLTDGGSFLNIAAGTTAKAQINLASSTAPTSPNNGDIWNDGTHLQFRVGGTTQQLDQQGSALLASANTWTNTNQFGNIGIGGAPGTYYITFPGTPANTAGIDFGNGVFFANTTSGILTITSASLSMAGSASLLLSTGSVRNSTSANNASITFPTASGPVASRNVADSGNAFAVNLVNASSTGFIQDFQFGGVSKAHVDKSGNITAANITLGTAGNALFITEGSNGRVGQAALVAGTKAITITGLTTSSRGFITLVSQGGTVTTSAQYIAVCTSNTLTISAVTSAGTNTIDTTDTSTLNYFVIN